MKPAGLALIALGCALASATEGAAQTPAATGLRVATEIRAYRTADDVARLDAISSPTLRLRDANVLAAALEVAGDARASTAARVMAMRVLILIRRPNHAVLYGALTNRPAGWCIGTGSTTHPVYRVGTRLPSDYDARIAVLTTSILADSSALEPVRIAAACLSRSAPGIAFDADPANVPILVVEEGISIRSVCGNTFTLRNPFELTMDVEVRQGSWSTKLTLPPKPLSSAFGETSIVVPGTVNVSVYEDLDDPDLHAEATCGGAPCP